MALLDRKAPEEVLSVAGVLPPGAFLIFTLLMIGEKQEDKAMRKAHGRGKSWW